MSANTPQKRDESARRRVALAFPIRLAHLHTIVRGMADYAQQHGNWIFTTSGEAHDLPIKSLKRWQGDGILASFGTDEEAAAARRMKIPVVTFVGVVKNPGIPRVMMDQAAIGRLAAEHLMVRGFRQFAFYGIEHAGYSLIREAAFSERLVSKGFSVDRCVSPNMLEHKKLWDDEIDELAKWLKTLPLPIGIFAVSDVRARMLADACSMIGRKIPQEIGIIGVDNSQMDCEFGSPQLTSIECDWWRVGYKAAELLDSLMNGQPPPAQDLLIQPTGIIARESTAVTIIEHPAVAKAVEYAKANLNESFGVKALVTAAGVSRRYLETAFLSSLHRTPADFLAEMRVERAKEMLATRTFTLSRVAQECGFSDLRQFRRVFTRVEKMSPRAFKQSGQQRQRNTDPLIR